MRTVRLVAAALLFAAACAPPEVPTRGATGSEAATPSSPSAVAVGADGRCVAHGVLAAACAKCVPALAAIYRAKGDWCAEHGLAESFCPACHPERGGRPGGVVSKDLVPPHGTRVKLLPELAALAGIEVATALPAESGVLGGLPVRIVPDVRRQARVGARLSGIVRELRVSPGTRVQAGDLLVVLDSPEADALRARRVEARGQLALAEQANAREQELLGIGVASQVEAQEAERRLVAARADAAAASSAAASLGTAPGRGDGVRAPVAGTITRVHATLGAAVTAGAPLCDIIDMSEAWAEIELPQSLLGRVSPGSLVHIRLDGVPGEPLQGTVEGIAPELDPVRRTALARVALVDRGGVLRANMTGHASVGEAGGSGAVVPESALQRTGDLSFAFVQFAPGDFELRRLRTGRTNQGLAEVLDGIAPGEAVVTTGSFLLRTEVMKDSIGAGCCDVE